MRLTFGKVERLPPIPFVLMAGMVGGVVLGVAGIPATSDVGVIATLSATWAAATALWWVSVRRRQHNVWSAGLQVACVIAVAQLIALALIITRAVAPTDQLPWQDVAAKALTPQLVLTPIRFVAAVMLVAVGRMLPGSGRGAVPLTPASSHGQVL